MMTEQQPQPQPRLQIPCFWKHILEAAEIKHWCQLGGSGLCIYVQRKKLTTPYISRVLQRMFATAKDLKTWSHSKKHLNTCMYVKIIPYLKNLNIPIMFYQWQLISTQKKKQPTQHTWSHTHTPRQKMNNFVHKLPLFAVRKSPVKRAKFFWLSTFFSHAAIRSNRLAIGVFP